MATNTYLYIKDKNGVVYKGGSKARGQQDKIEVLSWDTAFTQTLTGAVSGSGSGGKIKPTSEAGVFKFRKYYDTASDDLLYACWTGVELIRCVFEVYRSASAAEKRGKVNVAGEDSYFLCITLQKAYIAEYEIDGEDEDELPQEDIDIVYEKLLFEYREINPKTGAPENTKKVCWDWALNQEC